MGNLIESVNSACRYFPFICCIKVCISWRNMHKYTSSITTNRYLRSSKLIHHVVEFFGITIHISKCFIDVSIYLAIIIKNFTGLLALKNTLCYKSSSISIFCFKVCKSTFVINTFTCPSFSICVKVPSAFALC